MTLPRRFRQHRILIVGCGDVGLRAARELGQGRRARLYALTSSPGKAAALRAAGITPLLGNLDAPATLRRLAGLGQRVLHLAPPPTEVSASAGSERHATRPAQRHDPRTRALLHALALRTPPTHLAYGSTTGVYGDCGGARFDETRPVAPGTARAQRRVDAEAQLRWAGRRSGTGISLLRIPGIYAPDREGGTPRARLERGTPALRAEDDVFTNHIHADDLARACVAALFRGRPQRAYHVSDDGELKMGDYFQWAAHLYGLPEPRRITRAEAEATLPPMLMSFMSESRRLDNTRLKRELRVALRYPTVQQGLRAGLDDL
jgi:nucleoside-diphosphate-sugar epimerase